MSFTGEDPERRDHARAPIELKVEYKKLNTFFADYTKNICKGGTFIKTKKPLDVGTEFVFKLLVPRLGDPLALRGQVKWIVREGEEPPPDSLSVPADAVISSISSSNSLIWRSLRLGW